MQVVPEPRRDPVRLPAFGRALSLVPGTSWSREVLAGVTLAALCLPLNIGYAEAAGLPAIVGINASLLPLVIYAVTAGSRHLVIGPDATIAAILGATVPAVVASTGAEPAELALVTSVLVAVLLIGAWLLRLGTLVRFLSKAVLVGFLAGLAIEILTSQVAKIMAVSPEAHGWIREVWELVRSIPDASVGSVIVGVTTIAIVRLCKAVAPALPGAIIALVIVGVAVQIFDPSGVKLLGEIPSGLPSLSFPTVPLAAWTAMVPASLAIVALTIAEGLLIAGSTARRNGEPFAANDELFAIGGANVAAALTSGMPNGASGSRTAAIGATGSRTQVPAIVAAITIAIVVAFLTDLVAKIPSAALAGLVANAVVSLIDVAELRRFARVRHGELAIAIVCAGGVLVLGPVGGIVIATLATAVDVVRRAAGAPWARLGAPDAPLHERFTALDLDGEVPHPGIEFLRPGGPLFFAVADQLRDTLLELASQPGTAWVVVDCEQVSDLDPTAADAFAEALAEARAASVTVAVSRVTAPVRALLDVYDLTGQIGADHIYASNRAALAAFEARPS